MKILRRKYVNGMYLLKYKSEKFELFKEMN